MFKDKVLNEITVSLRDKILIIENELNILSDEKNNITKSSAGDKFETSRSTMQIEYDKLNNQLIQKKNQLKKIELLDTKKKYKSVNYGSLVITNTNKYLISIGLGQYIIDDHSVFAISLSSPIGRILLDKKKGDSFIFNNNAEKIIDII
tara:strand:- start:12225 stop:12671 length:447 start_codon:yes stop_codon:yes gene_type:complete